MSIALKGIIKTPVSREKTVTDLLTNDVQQVSPTKLSLSQSFLSKTPNNKTFNTHASNNRISREFKLSESSQSKNPYIGSQAAPSYVKES